MSSHRKEWTKYLKEYKYKKPPIPRSFKPKGYMAIAQVLANWFNMIIEGAGDTPDKDGNISFDVPYNKLLEKACVGEMNTSLRKALKKYGFTFRKSSRTTMQITKHS